MCLIAHPSLREVLARPGYCLPPAPLPSPLPAPLPEVPVRVDAPSAAALSCYDPHPGFGPVGSILHAEHECPFRNPQPGTARSVEPQRPVAVVSRRVICEAVVTPQCRGRRQALCPARRPVRHAPAVAAPGVPSPLRALAELVAAAPMPGGPPEWVSAGPAPVRSVVAPSAPPPMGHPVAEAPLLRATLGAAVPQVRPGLPPPAAVRRAGPCVRPPGPLVAAEVLRPPPPLVPMRAPQQPPVRPAGVPPAPGPAPAAGPLPDALIEQRRLHQANIGIIDLQDEFWVSVCEIYCIFA